LVLRGRGDLPLDCEGAQEACDFGRPHVGGVALCQSGRLRLREVRKRARVVPRRWDMRRSGSIEGRHWPCPGGSPFVREFSTIAERVGSSKANRRSGANPADWMESDTVEAPGGDTARWEWGTGSAGSSRKTTERSLACPRPPASAGSTARRCPQPAPAET
jgi:hypothetical protein